MSLACKFVPQLRESFGCLPVSYSACATCCNSSLVTLLLLGVSLSYYSNSLEFEKNFEGEMLEIVENWYKFVLKMLKLAEFIYI